MSRAVESVYVRYGCAVAFAALATAAGLALGPRAGGHDLFLTFFPAVVAAAWCGGFGPSVATLAACGVAAAVLSPPAGPGARLGPALFALAGLAVARMGGALRSSRRRAEASGREARERLESEHAARGRAEDLAAAIDASVDLIYVLDREGRYVHVSEGAARAVGRTRAEVVGKTWRELGLSAEVMAPFDVQRARVCATGTPERHEVDYPSPEGVRHYEYALTPAGGSDRVVVLSRDVTDRKRAEAERERLFGELETQRRRLEAVVESVPAGIVFAEAPSGRVVFGNRRVEQILRGAPPTSAGDGRGWLHPDGRPVRDGEWTLDRALRGESVRGDEFVCVRGDGSRGWVRVSGAPVRDTAGAVLGGVVAIDDIDPEKRAGGRQALLAEAGKILGSSLDYEATLTSVCGLVVPGFADWCALDLRAEGGEVRRLAVAHTDPAKVALAHDLSRRYPPRPDDERGLMKVLRTGEPDLFPDIPDELLVHGARDAEHLALLRALGLRSAVIVPLVARGRTLGALTLVTAESGRAFDDDDLRAAHELSTRAALAVDNARLFSEAREAARRREEALLLHRGVEEKLTLLVEASGSLNASAGLPTVLSAVLDLSRRLVEADAYAVWRFDRAAGLWGIAHAAGLSDDYRRATIPVLGDAPEMPSTPIVAEDVLGSPALGGREPAYAREGIRSLLSVPLNVRGQVNGTLAFYYHNPHRFSEVELRAATALSNLAGSAVGTAELYGELTEADRRKDEFLAMLAHELRNPLSALSNAVRVARDEGAGGWDWSRGVIERQVRHFARLIDDLLDVARINRGKIRLQTRVIDVGPVLRAAVESVQPLVDERRHTLEVDLDPGPLWVEADATRIEQVAVNLLTNAAKYTDAGGRIWLSARQEGGEAVVRVRDDGLGIPPEKLPQMFELFAQGDRSLARSEGGLGIGLTLVRSLTEMHGGGVTARSDGPGRGSEFVVRLPSAAAPAPADPAEGPRAPGGGAPRRVLVVDDSPDAAHGMARFLKHFGHQVRAAYDGPTAIDAAREYRPDVVLLDIGLPGMDGYAVAAALRGEPFGADATIIAVSGYGQEDDRRRSREAGVDHHLVKPVDHDELLGLVAAHTPRG